MEILRRFRSFFQGREPVTTVMQLETPSPDKWQPAVDKNDQVIPGMFTRPMRMYTREELFQSDFFREVEKRDPTLAALTRFLAYTNSPRS